MLYLSPASFRSLLMRSGLTQNQPRRLERVWNGADFFVWNQFKKRKKLPFSPAFTEKI